MASGRFEFSGIFKTILGRGGQRAARPSSWTSRHRFIRPLSLHETISRAGLYAIGIAGMCGLTYLFLYISEILHG